MKFIYILLVFMLGCTSQQARNNEAVFDIVEAPREFHSPLLVLENNRVRAEESSVDLPEKITLKSKQWRKYVSWKQEWERTYYEQVQVENELFDKQEIILEPGVSYAFDLESFCLDPSSSAPAEGDGLNIGSIPNEMKSWLPDLIAKYSSAGLTQDQTQALIWALVTDTQFDELSADNQKSLLKIFSDAPVRFGKRRLESLGRDILDQILPNSVIKTIEDLQDLRSQFLQFQDDFDKLKEVMAPKSHRLPDIKTNWLHSADGYLIKVTAYGYSNVHVDLFVPEGSNIRTPQGIKEIIFSIKNLIGIPAKGQRLAISAKSRKKENPKKECDKLRAFHPDKCRNMTDEDRSKIVFLSNPENFPQTRYASPPSGEAKIEEETDCSHFVNEIYHRSGFEYPYISSGEITCLSLFSLEPVENAKPGDLILYNGHIGIVDSSGDVVSATVGGHQQRSKRRPGDVGFIPSITANKKETFGKSRGVLKWKCQ